jgi:recombinational DNA repair protein RecR
LQKEKEMNSYNSPESLLKTVSSLPNSVSSHSQARVINIELKRSVDIEQIQTLHDDIEAATDKLTWIDTACKKKYEELSEICAQIRTLEKYIERFKKGQDYQELEAMVKNKVGEFLMCSLL